VLKANKISGRGFGKDALFEVTLAGSDTGTIVIGTINDTRSRFELGDRSFQITRSGFLAPRLALKCADAVIATASQKALRNYYTVVAGGGREWTFRAMDLLATKFGLFEGEAQIGAVCAGPWMNRVQDITAELPEKMPREVQMFLLAVFIGKLTTNE
jgi:hypothetical protein